MRTSHERCIHRAELEFGTAFREMNEKGEANFTAVCHHAALCAVHYLQARLAVAGLPFPSTPHPVVLLECCLDLEPTWEGFRQDLRMLYLNAHDTQALEAEDLDLAAAVSMEALQRVRTAVRATLGFHELSGASL